MIQAGKELTLSGSLVSNTKGTILMDSPDYASGDATIKIYTNVSSISKHNLTIDGSLLKTTSIKPGVLNATSYSIVYGTLSSGSMSSMNKADDTPLKIASIHHHSHYHARIDVSFYAIGLAPNILLSLEYALRVKTSINTHLRMYTRSNGDWDEHQNIASSPTSYTWYNHSITNVNPTVSHIYQMRIDARDGGAFNLDIDCLILKYVINSTIEGYILLDTFALDTTSYSDGLHQLKSSIDTYSGGKYTLTKSIVIDNTDPVITSLTYSPSAPNNSKTMIIEATIDEDNPEDSYGSYEAYDSDIIVPNGISTSFKYKNVFSNGSYTFTMTAIDKAGNIGTDDITFDVAFAVKKIKDPSLCVLSPSTIVRDSIDDELNVTTWNAKGFNLYLYKDGVKSSKTWYDGNESTLIAIDATGCDEIAWVVELFDYKNSFYMNTSFESEIIDLQIIKVQAPSIEILAPNEIYRDYTDGILEITSKNASGYWLHAFKDSVKLGKTWYDGNDTDSIAIDPSDADELSWTIQLYNGTGKFYGNYTVTTTIIEPEIVEIKYPSVNAIIPDKLQKEIVGAYMTITTAESTGYWLHAFKDSMKLGKTWYDGNDTDQIAIDTTSGTDLSWVIELQNNKGIFHSNTTVATTLVDPIIAPVTIAYPTSMIVGDSLELLFETTEEADFSLTLDTIMVAEVDDSLSLAYTFEPTSTGTYDFSLSFVIGGESIDCDFSIIVNEESHYTPAKPVDYSWIWIAIIAMVAIISIVWITQKKRRR